ncbi:MAG: alpha/beta hydrolase [Alphaproteobacteria bacterium]
MPAPIIMVHGAFCGGWAFEAFKAPFEAAGHSCMTPDLPGHSPGEGNAVCGLSVRDYARSVADIIEACPEPPVVIGHSLGGLVAQLAAARARVQGLVLLAPTAPWGESGGSIEEAAVSLGLIGMGAPWFQVVEPSPSVFAACGLERLTSSAQEAVFARMGSESGRALWETFNWWLDPFMATRVETSAIGSPALVIAGELDPIHGPASVRSTAIRLGAEFRSMPGMSHWLIGEPGWDAVAGACLEWMEKSRREAA